MEFLLLIALSLLLENRTGTYVMDSITYLQWTLFLSRLTSISNYFLGPLNISTNYTLIPTLYLEHHFLELLSILGKYSGPVPTNLSLSQTFCLHVL